MAKDGYRVLKCDSDLFLIDVNGTLCLCNARRKVSATSDIISGDFVQLEKTEDDTVVINSVLPRKNILVRPKVANIDKIIIIIAPIPEVDYFLIDKLIINARRQGLEVVLCVNKTDLDVSINDEVTKQYRNAVDDIIFVSAAKNDISSLEHILHGSLNCLAGQSAVGKSSIINSLVGENKRAVGALSQKNERGKNTTTSAEIIRLSTDTYIIDTPGFSMLDIHGELPFEELDLYYDEFMPFADKCRYNRCSHTVEPDCAVKAAIAAGEIDESRYERYKLIREELKIDLKQRKKKAIVKKPQERRGK